MPAYVAFGKSWRIGSDDFTIPGIIEFIVRFIWFTSIITLYATNGFGINCSGCYYLEEFIIGLISLQMLILVNLIAIISISSRGTIINAYPRRHLTKALVFRLCFFAAEIGCYIAGSVCIFGPSLHCGSKYVLYFLYGSVVISWLLFLSHVILFFLYFNPLAPNVKDDYSISQSAKRWNRRLKFLCCCCFCGSNDERSTDAFSEVAGILAHFFQGELVLSDITAGLILMSLADNINKKTPAIPSSHPVNNMPQEEWMTVSNANNFIKYAVGSYGWPMYMYDNIFCGFCKLWSNMRCCSSFKPDSSIIDDNCCMCHMAAVKKITGAQPDDFVHVSFFSRIYETPFYIVCDHETKSIIVSVRGTISINDVLTDLSVESGVIDNAESLQPLRAHNGMLKAAHSIKQILLDRQLLVQAFQLYPDYQLVITGHSLGAGTASILAILLQPIYPKLHCFAFSPPGCMFNKELYELSKNIIMSVVVGDDLIISVSWQTMEKLKVDLRDAIEQCTVPKYQVLLHYCCNPCDGCSCRVKPDPAEDSPNSSISRLDQTPLLSQQPADKEQKPFTSLSYPPGSILHMKRIEGSNEEFVATWADASLFQCQVSISLTMASDHMPNYVQVVLAKYLNCSSQFAEA